MIKLKPAVLISWLLILIVDAVCIGFSSMLAVGNVNFMFGLGFMIVAAFLIVKNGHLFTGWRFNTKKKTDLEQENLPKQPKVNEVGSIKNQAIKFSAPTKYCLYVGGLLIILGIGLTII
ncbi:DUF3899 domain-containing protein [Lentilactobacillus sp. SPB1-3]|uniref:DUF3899 domain-containing protein n=1 Tax=Lentilactobacillus terminaliae TaxID=3003483 RepID=A0ACD5DG31_9LACO|nr:DUF3899 domain-containing protein [Lentilactobacillus sp. SPB1-3]MCZ0977934.1 DUF3899 domain-containing protein [Lentilactobacillus sp. SPB1-3]